MALMERAIVAAESIPWPDAVAKAGIHYLVSRSRRKLAHEASDVEQRFVTQMMQRPIAVATDEANAQHYEIPSAFFAAFLGPHRKYSCCLYESGSETLEQAEALALAETCRHADLADGQDVLELGCGWGSLSLWMAENYSGSRIIAVSNSRSQREYIEGQARERGLSNLQVITADMNAFTIDRTFDRIVSVEMFEHMSNWRNLLERVRGWIRPDGRMFIHIFTHKRAPYAFDENDKTDWIAQHFFTGGVMPSHNLIRQFSDLFTVEKDWRWNGVNYEHTARQWLENFDEAHVQVGEILRDVYGNDAELWRRRWRLFFLATMGLFGHAGGEEWGVSHYLLAPADAAASRG